MPQTTRENHQPSPLVFMDTETTGVHGRRVVWEVGVIRRDPPGTRLGGPNGRRTVWQTFVDADLSEADRFGLKVGGYYDRHPLGRRIAGLAGEQDAWTGRPALSPEHTAMRVAELTHGAHIIGAVPSFDTDSLEALLGRHQLISSWHYHIICAEVLAVGYLAALGQVFTPPYDSDELTAALGIEPAPPELRHTALADAEWAERIYDRVMAGPLGAPR